MEKKFRLKSINTVIWLLAAAMLAGILFVSIFTVASRRKNNVPTETSAPETSAPTETQKPRENSVRTSGEESAAAIPTDVPPAEAADETVALNTKDVSADAITQHYFVLPVDGTIEKGFEIDVPVFSATMNDYRAHTGVDIAAPVGSEVAAASSGVIARVWNDPMMGCSVMIDHGDGIYTTYMNLAEGDLGLTVGQRVGMGQMIGRVGETALVEIAEAPHLHLEMKQNGQPLDPLDYLAFDQTMAEVVYEG